MRQGRRARHQSPYARWLLPGSIAAAIITALLVLLVDVPLYPALMCGSSVALFLLYGFDKHRAVVGGGRAPELVLHGMALAGGFAGGWAGRALFRHKTRSAGFFVVLLISTAVHAVIVFWLWR